MRNAETIAPPVTKAPVPLVEARQLPIGTSFKVKSGHLERVAIVYVRQSTPKQVMENRESAARQYNFAEQAVALGWPRERVLTIDEDQGKSAKTVEGRSGFQRLIGEVTSDHVGIVLGLEMSRLARSSKDWHAFFEMCAVFDTLIADQDGVYHGDDPNDRLVLGMKGIMSEMELFTMRARLDRGSLNKAQRGELFLHSPIGYVKSANGNLVLDPDEQVRAIVQLVFDKFAELGSATRVYRYLIRQRIRMGVRPLTGANRGELEWRRPCRSTVLNILRSPIYAGAYVFGRRRLDPRDKHRGRPFPSMPLPNMDDWRVLLRDRLPAYITWERYMENREQMKQNRARWNAKGAPRHGPALLGGLIRCESCGYRMGIEYRGRQPRGTYVCCRHNNEPDAPRCPTVQASVVDRLVTEQVLRALEPAALELSIQARQNVQRERERQDQLWSQRLERAQYECDRAARQYHAVEPENRLVARTLEMRWEEALNQQRNLKEEHDRFVRENSPQLSAAEQERIVSLAKDIPALWKASGTTPLERQTIVRHLVEKVIVSVRDLSDAVDVTIHWAGGFVSQYEVSRDVQHYEQLSRFTELRDRVTELRAAGWIANQIAEQLNRERFRPPRGGKFNEGKVGELMRQLGLGIKLKADATAAFFASNEWWIAALAQKLRMNVRTLHRWRKSGWIHSREMPGNPNRWLVWANKDELARLRKLRDCPVDKGAAERYPKHLTTPKQRTEATK